MVPVESGPRGYLRRKDFLDSLDFAEMIAAADATKRSIKYGAVKTSVRQDAVCFTLPRLIERAQSVGQLVEPQLARCNIKLKQPHAAADVGADQLRVNPVRQNGAAHRAIFTWMEVRHGRDRLDSRQSGDVLELKRGVTLYPGFG